jgi:hypothetical protein
MTQAIQQRPVVAVLALEDLTIPAPEVTLKEQFIAQLTEKVRGRLTPMEITHAKPHLDKHLTALGVHQASDIDLAVAMVVITLNNAPAMSLTECFAALQQEAIEAMALLEQSNGE